MEKTDISVGQMIRSNQYCHGVPPGTLGVICQIDDLNVMVAWYLCDRPLPNLTPQSIAELPEEDPQCPLRDRLPLNTALQCLDTE